MKIAILTRNDDASPKVLALSLKTILKSIGVEADIIYKISYLNRLLPIFGKNKQKGNLHFVLRRKLKYFFDDLLLERKLKRYDAIIISECEPNGFWKDYYAIEKLRNKLNIPIIFHEVYYLGNMPSHVKSLKERNHPTIERYDWHLAVSGTSEIKTKPKPPWSCIGLNLQEAGLKPDIKKELFAIVDFEYAQYSKYRKQQIEILKELHIPYIGFDKRMTLSEIRNYYKKASILFMQTPETFGVPIAECLACGATIFTPSSLWPIAWRIDENPRPNQKGTLPSCFAIYHTYTDLKEKLRKYKHDFNPINTPIITFKTFIEHYPHFYYGNQDAAKDLIERIRERNFV